MGVNSETGNIDVKMVTVEVFISAKHYFRPVLNISFYNTLALIYAYPKTFQSKLER